MTQSDAPIVIPDLHGCLDLLELALEKFSGRPLIFLGDLVDRGPDTPGVLARIRPLVESGQAIALMGNHDAIFLGVLLDGWMVPGWEASYLNPTLAQYPSHQAAVDDARWMRQHLRPWTTWRHVYLSHAAPHRVWNADPHFPDHLWARPGVDGRAALPDDCTFAVHGHTITLSLREDRQPLPVLLPQDDGTKALYLDTGAFHTGVLTALDLADMDFHPFTLEQP